MESEKFYQRAASGNRLADSERIRLTPTHLFQLALAGAFQLTQGEKDRLSPDHLVELAIAGLIVLSDRDAAKLSPSQLTAVLDSKEDENIA